MCGVCVGVCGCARVCVGVRECAQVYAGVHRCVRVWEGVHRCAQVWAGVHGCAQVCVDMHRCAYVCGMNFQNFFWRIESLHQRTLIHFLYEFFLLSLCNTGLKSNFLHNLKLTR